MNAPSPKSITDKSKSQMSQTMTEKLQNEVKVNLVVETTVSEPVLDQSASRLPNMSPNQESAKLDSIEEKSVDDQEDNEVKIA